MTKTQKIALWVAAAIVALVILRWPTIQYGIVEVAHSEVTDDYFVLEYRMSQPFSLKIAHVLQEPASDEKGPEFSNHIGAFEVKAGAWTAERSEVVANFDSSMTWIRGEHAVRIRVSKGDSLTIKHKSEEIKVKPFGESALGDVAWNPPSDGTGYGNAVGDSIVHFLSSDEQPEFLIFYAGTGIGSDE